jgi:glycosyltransferase involved in cell wall biosynthesis
MTTLAIDTSILVTTFRRPRHLELVLQSIAGQQGVPPDFEVIVADDGSDDGTAESVAAFARTAEFPVRFTTQPHEGFRLARVRNNAARLAAGRYLMFLDGDCVLPSHHLAAHRQRRRSGTALLGYCGRLSEAASRGLGERGVRGLNLADLVPPEEARILARRHRRARWHAVIRHPTKPRLAGGDFGVWRTDFERVNGFDERFEGWGQEDDDLGLRLRTSGVRLESILDKTCSLHVWHPTDPTATRRWRDGVNVGYFTRRGRLASCRRGLESRHARDILWGLPRDIAVTALGRRVQALLAGASLAPPGAACEIEIVVASSAGRFIRPAECRLLLIEEGMRPDRRLVAQADRSEVVDLADDASLAAILETAG